jgi:hypothetical protein
MVSSNACTAGVSPRTAAVIKASAGAATASVVHPTASDRHNPDNSARLLGNTRRFWFEYLLFVFYQAFERTCFTIASLIENCTPRTFIS